MPERKLRHALTKRITASSPLHARRRCSSFSTRKPVTKWRGCARAGEWRRRFTSTLPATHLLIGGEGIISVIQQQDPDHYELIANVPTTVGRSHRLWYTKRDRFYVGVPAKGNESCPGLDLRS